MCPHMMYPPCRALGAYLLWIVLTQLGIGAYVALKRWVLGCVHCLGRR